MCVFECVSMSVHVQVLQYVCTCVRLCASCYQRHPDSFPLSPRDTEAVLLVSPPLPVSPVSPVSPRQPGEGPSWSQEEGEEKVVVKVWKKSEKVLLK